MIKFKRYNLVIPIEAAAWGSDVDMNRVTVHSFDKKGGSPKLGDMIVREPDAPGKGMVLISEAVFKENYHRAGFWDNFFNAINTSLDSKYFWFWLGLAMATYWYRGAS